MITLVRATLLAATVLMAIASEAGAQASAPINFDGLPRKQQPAKAPAPAKSDSSAKQHKPPVAAAAPVVRIDTLYRTFVDTVRLIQLVDTATLRALRAPAPAAVPAPSFGVNGLSQVTFTAGDATRSTYRLRRIELKVTADLGDRAQAVLMVDAAKSLALSTSGAQTTVNQSSRMLQDAFVSIPVSRLTIDAGQERLPLGYEGSMGASGLETVERALMESEKARSASFGDVRDAGVSVKQTWSFVDYRVGLFNGSGETMNDVDKQVAKALVGAVAFHPGFLEGFRVGASGATSGSAAGDNPTRDRVGADVRFARGPVALQAEAMSGQDGATRRLGAYALATWAFHKQAKVVARVDSWDPDRAADNTAANVAEHDYLGGFTWLPAGTRLKLQLNVVRKTYVAGLVPSSTLVLSQLQASW